jgi:hypothetical protein
MHGVPPLGFKANESASHAANGGWREDGLLRARATLGCGPQG